MYNTSFPIISIDSGIIWVLLILIKTVMIGPGKKRRTLKFEITNMDPNSYNYFQSLPSVNFRSFDELRSFFQQWGQQVQHRIPVSHMLLTLSEHWKFFEENCCLRVDDSNHCESFSSYCQIFCDTVDLQTNDSEGTMYRIIDSALLIFSIVLGKQRSRNTRNTTSGLKMPDYTLESIAPLLIGEDKLLSNYKPGIYGHDPLVELLSKIPFQRWSEFYGELPFIFGYYALGQSSVNQFYFGCIVAKTRNFEILFEANLCDLNVRPVVAAYFFNLLPVFKLLKDILAKFPIGLSLSWTKENVHNRFGLRKCLSVLVEDNEPVLVVKWFFIGNDAANRMQTFFQAQQEIFHVLQTRQDAAHQLRSKDRLCPFKILSESEDIRVGFKGILVPYACPIRPNTIKDMVAILIDVCEELNWLHQNRIVHNDIRWENIMEFNGRVCIVDYDDAFLLSDAHQYCPPLLHLDSATHHKSVFQDHRYEADLYAIGLLIDDAQQRLRPLVSDELLDVSRKIQRCESITIDQVMTFLKSI
jgi:hypothetical protein